MSRPQPVEIIAEAGVNHNGSVDLAHELVDVAATVGADTVKFQTFVTDDVVAADAPAAAYQVKHTGAATQADLVRSLELPPTAWTELRHHALERGLRFLSTPFDRTSADRLVELGVDALKVPSGEITNLPFLRDLASRGLPLIVSTGASTLDEVGTAIEALAAAPSIVLMHCVSAYPADPAVANLRAISLMRTEFGLDVGWSDHTVGHLTAVVAVSLGAVVLEKHLTTDRSLPGPDHQASADPDQLAEYVAQVRATETALGRATKEPQPEEADVRRLARRSWHTTGALETDHHLTASDITAVRPATGIPPTVDIIGRTLARDLPPGSPIHPGDLHPERP